MSELDDAKASGQTGDEAVMAEAKTRFHRCQEWESIWQDKFAGDLKFRHGDAENGWQWPDGLRRDREFDRKPCLTMNIVRQHNLQISNSARQKKSGMKVIPTGGPASMAAANIYKEIIRDIEYRSAAQDIYAKAVDFQVDGGIGYWRLKTEYRDDDSDLQCIRLCPVNDPLSIILDCDIQEKTGKDALYGFAFDLVPKDQVSEAYLKLGDMLGSNMPLFGGGPFANWIKKDHVWICEYFRKVTKKDVLIGFIDPKNGERKFIRKSLLSPEAAQALMDLPTAKWRNIYPETVEWRLIVGDQVVDKTIWPGKWIPIIRVVGEENVIDGILDRKGHTRNMKDAQRMYNYNASSQVEFVALQGKTPWVGAAKAIEGLEEYWQTANYVNHSILPYNHMDEEFPERPIPPPQRQEPPNAAPAYQAGMETAFNQMMMTSGQWQNQMGMMGNERTGRAIAERKQQSDTSVYHFEANFESALVFSGEQIIDLVPKVLDTRQVYRCLAEDGSDLEFIIDPSAKQAYMEHLDQQGKALVRVFNPNLGEYGIAADVGPSYTSKQGEAMDRLAMLMTEAPQLIPLIGDLLLKNMDFDDAQEAARRVRRMVPPQALGQGPTQNEQKLMQQLQAAKMALAQSIQETAKKDVKLVGKAQMRDIEAYRAETDRFKALADSLNVDPQGLQEVVHQLVQEALETKLDPIARANADTIDTETAGLSGAPPSGASMRQQPDESGFSPPPGARQAPDGEWYVNDPRRPGKYMRVLRRAQG